MDGPSLSNLGTVSLEVEGGTIHSTPLGQTPTYVTMNMNDINPIFYEGPSSYRYRVTEGGKYTLPFNKVSSRVSSPRDTSKRTSVG